MQSAPSPTVEQLEGLAAQLGVSDVSHLRRLRGGLGCTMDVIGAGGRQLVLRRYGPWYAERGEDAAAREARAVALVRSAGVSAPEAIWVDVHGVFPEQAIVTSYIDGTPDLNPADPTSWAEQLAVALAKIHTVELVGEDLTMFAHGQGEDDRQFIVSPERASAHPLGSRLVERRRALESTIEREAVFVHADFWPGNTLWSDGTLVAVVDWEAPAQARPGLDVAYCTMDMHYLGPGGVVDHFGDVYRQSSGRAVTDLDYRRSVALCRPLPDIADWVPAWTAMGVDRTAEDARRIHHRLIETFLAATD